MKLGLVTVLYNCSPFLETFLDCLAGQKLKNFSLYCIDNASNDNCMAIAVRYASKMRLIAVRNELNIGVAAANNQGILMALEDKCDYVVICNNDITFGEEVIERIAQKIKKYEGCMLAPKILFGDGTRIYYDGGTFSRIRGVSKHYRYAKEDRYAIKMDCIQKYASTAFLVVPAKLFENDLMDDKYFIYCDDSDFMHRMLKKKVRLIYCPDINILHFASSSTGGSSSDFALYCMNRNTIYFLKKNYPVLGYFYILIFIFRTVIKLLFFSPKKIDCVTKAIFDGFKM